MRWGDFGHLWQIIISGDADVFEEGMTTVVTVRDFSVIFDSYSQFEDGVLSIKLINMDDSDEDGNEDEEKRRGLAVLVDG